MKNLFNARPTNLICEEFRHVAESTSMYHPYGHGGLMLNKPYRVRLLRYRKGIDQQEHKHNYQQAAHLFAAYFNIPLLKPLLA